MGHYYRSYGTYKKADEVAVGNKRKFNDKIFTLIKIIPREKSVGKTYASNLRKKNYVRIIWVKKGLAVYTRKK